MPFRVMTMRQDKALERFGGLKSPGAVPATGTTPQESRYLPLQPCSPALIVGVPQNPRRDHVPMLLRKTQLVVSIDGLDTHDRRERIPLQRQRAGSILVCFALQDEERRPERRQMPRASRPFVARNG